jgi:isoleucyl-tRNA synthetase
VTDSDGTGIVHCAPGFGEDDYNACLAQGLIKPGKAPCPVDPDGNLLPIITDFAGLYVKDADNLIKDNLK